MTFMCRQTWHLVLVPFLLLACSRTNTIAEYIQKADAHRAANNLVAAEKTLQQGLLAHPKSYELTRALMQLYERSEQWEKLDNYVKISPPGMDPFEHARMLGTLAEHYFERRDWR